MTSVLSLGNIADSVFTFKGFLAQGIESYRAVTGPLRLLIAQIPFPFPLSFDLLVLSVMMGAGYGKANNRLMVYYTPKRAALLAFEMALTLFLLFSFLFPLAQQTARSDKVILYTFILVPFLSLLTGILIQRDYKKKYRHIETGRPPRSVRYQAFAYGMKYIGKTLLGLYLLIAILSAISSGLARPLG